MHESNVIGTVSLDFSDLPSHDHLSPWLASLFVLPEARGQGTGTALIDFDVVLTEIATGLYRLMARQLVGYETAKARQIYRHFLDTPAQIEIGAQRVEVQLPKRAHNPLLIAAGVSQKEIAIPWWENYKLAISFV
jgi:GNAT superfamily N-acetyltransferase